MVALPGNAPDNLGALGLVEAREADTGVTVEETVGDAAYGAGDTRQVLPNAGRTLIARVPGRPAGLTFRGRAFGLIRSRVPAPVQRGRSPGRLCLQGGAPTKWVDLTVWRPSDPTRRPVGRARCGPGASCH